MSKEREELIKAWNELDEEERQRLVKAKKLARFIESVPTFDDCEECGSEESVLIDIKVETTVFGRLETDAVTSIQLIPTSMNSPILNDIVESIMQGAHKVAADTVQAIIKEIQEERDKDD